MLIEEAGLRILTDPGMYSPAAVDIENIDVILITHEHQDHIHIESLKKILAKNQKAKVVTNQAAGKLLGAEKIPYELLQDGKQMMEKGIVITALGDKHTEIYKTLPPMQNTGFMIAEKLFYPGDCFFKPEKNVEILALPVAGPWMKLSEAIDYALAVNPKVCFPVHDGILKNPGSAHKVTGEILAKNGIKFVVLEERKSCEF